MEDVPPSYESAVNKEAWNVIAPWIPSSDLCSACLVSAKWHSIFIPFLWGDPASHFGTENDAVYVALTRFKRTLKKARLSVRQLTHTLHLPPALSEIYGGPNTTWLRDVLEYLPNLQSLIVSKLPFFDHHSLFALRHASARKSSVGDADEPIPTYGLKLLRAVREPNSTSASLAKALRHFIQLVYLDLSYTTPARDAAVLASLSGLHDLQVLKLRGVGLRDSEAEVLANTIGIRVRLLDLRENLLTDMSVRSLMHSCFIPLDLQSTTESARSRRVEDWPVGIAPGPELFSLESLQSEDLDQELVKQLTNPLTGRLAFEDIPHRGLSHLYLSENRLSVEGLSDLLKSSRLHVLDGGSVDDIKTISRTKSIGSPSGWMDTINYTGAEKLISVLDQYAKDSLTYLRIDHAVVTSKCEAVEKPTPPSSATELATKSNVAELPPEDKVISEAPAPLHYPVEMPSEREPIFELSAEPAMPKHELPGDCIHFALSPPIGNAPVAEPEELRSPVKADGSFAPEVVTNGRQSEEAQFSGDEEVVVNATGTGLTPAESKSNGEAHPPSPVGSPPSPLANPPSPVGSPQSPTGPSFPTRPTTLHPNKPSLSSARIARIDMLLAKRPKLQGQQNGEVQQLHPTNGVTALPKKSLLELHPSILPHVRTLVLTNVPASVPHSSPVIPALCKFISCCADEAALALLQAQTNYSLPPGRSRQAAELQHARSLFALRQIVLEMATPSGPGSSDGVPRGWNHSRQRISMSKSSTGDNDSENMWSAAENDFSFFGEEGEEQDECGIYQHDPDKYFPTAHLDDKIVVSPGDAAITSPTRTTFSSDSTHSLERTSSLLRSPTIVSSPRNLPLGRNRRRSSGSTSSHERIRGGLALEMVGSAPTSHPVKAPQPPVLLDEPMLDVVAEVATFRRERKAEYEGALLRWRISNNANGIQRSLDGMLVNGVSVVDERDMPYVPGHWKGEVKVVRNAAPKGRTGVVDMYGNYFEKGYLYP